MPDGPVVSVVVPTYDRPDRLARLVAALERQDITSSFEVVIVDDGSPAGTAAELDRLAAATPLDLRTIRLSANSGPAVARNTGWQATRAPLVAFTDDDCVPDPGWLRALVAAMENADVVEGLTRPDPDGAWGPWSRSVTAEADRFFPTCNVGYRRELLERLGGFDPSYRKACDDTDLAIRAEEAGASTAYAQEALVNHEVSPSDYGAWLREKPRWEAVPLIVSRHPAVRSRMYRSWAWRSSHPPTLAAVGGIAALLAGAVRIRSLDGPALLLAGAAMLVPYVRFRTRRAPLPGVGPRRRLLLLPATFIGDVAEVAVLVRASVRYRTFVL